MRACASPVAELTPMSFLHRLVLSLLVHLLPDCQRSIATTMASVTVAHTMLWVFAA